MKAEVSSISPNVRIANGLPKETRVAVLFHRFGPYHHARLNAAGQLMTVWGVEACALEDTYAWDQVAGASAFKRITLTGRDTGDRRWKQEVQREMRRTLTEIKPQVVVVPGWASADALSALEWCVETQTPSVVMSESTAWDERRVGWKEWVKSRLVKLNSAGLAGGTAHADYLAQLGLAPDRIALGYDIVDNDYFAERAAGIRNQAAEIRKQYDLPEKYFLVSARFVEKKNLFRVVQAYARYLELAREPKAEKAEAAGDGSLASQPWKLIVLGDGALRESLKSEISRLNLQDQVRLPGFKQYDELPAYFALAGAFVHASTTEQWGLVVNEAMASGLPVLVSTRCGCAADLVSPGVNGFQFDPEKVEELAQLLRKISAADFPLSAFGAASRRIISGWGPGRFANGLRDAVAAALKNPRAGAGATDRVLLQLLLRR